MIMQINSYVLFPLHEVKFNFSFKKKNIRGGFGLDFPFVHCEEAAHAISSLPAILLNDKFGTYFVTSFETL